MTRIFSSPSEAKPEIDKAAVLDFFEKRAEKAEVLGPTRAVIYQDKSLDLAERRDKAEKELLYPLLQLKSTDNVLDAGCGTGRWAESIIPVCGSYCGVDVSPGLIQIARQRYGHYSNARFSVCSLDEISLDATKATRLFTCVVSFGVYIYLNDDSVLQALRRLAKVAAPQAKILFREPIATSQRLTLRDHFSEEMAQYYSAIYRTEEEFISMIDSTLGTVGFELIDSGDVYSEPELNNRAETKQRWFLLAR